ncbi:MAG: ABC transporter permease [Acidimicrobiia bacterium]
MSDLRPAGQLAEPDTGFAGHDEEAEAILEPAGSGPAATTSLWSDAWKQLRTSPLFLISLGLVVLFSVMAIAPQLFTSANPRDCNLSNSLVRPSAEHWFGFDLQGCDYYARTVYGARISMAIGVTVIAFAALLAVILGSVSGYFGGVLDAVIARITDVWFAIPTILGGIVILSLLGNRGFYQVSFVLIILGWPTMLRLYRSSVLSVKEMDYVEAARALGASDYRLLKKHILPNAITPLIIYAAISIGVVISAEAALSFLGVGLQLPAISWGLMISGTQTRILQAPHLLLFPGLFLSLAVFGFILMGDALRDALDPKSR